VISPQETKADAAPSPQDEIRRLNAQLAHEADHHALEMNSAQAEMDTFAHSISHDLRSPLTVIIGFADLLAKSPETSLDDTGRHYVDRITSSAGEMARMLDEILALSRMSRSEMHFVRMDLDLLVRRIANDLDAHKGDRRVIWLIGRLPTIEADPTLIRQAITGLMSNALKFTASREVARIQVGAMGDDREVSFFVRDNGASMDIKHRERMFGSFKRPNSSSHSEGSAIGLTYVQRIIQRHGGRSWTETVPDGGAVFHFSLPGHVAKPLFRPES
jgi:signal transduction histidine kinase